tara:strand:+ start:510 stop:2360 length:1851 start_codon:yes stop_codon:yes gene_type:complete
MRDLDKAIRAAMMTAHRYARGGYADRGFVDDAPDSVLMRERDESTYGPTNLEERKARIQEMTTPTNYPGDKLEAPMGYMTPATAVEWKLGDAGPYAVNAEGNTLPLIPQPGMLPMYRDPTIDSIRPAMPGVIDLVGNVVGAPLGITARRVIQAGMTGERPAANVLNIFGGEKAQTADLAALDTAKKMASAGADQNQIIKETGWFQGPDEKWRFEIPDFKSRVTDQVFNNIKEKGIHEGPLSAGLEHYKLYEAYPQLNEMQATFGASAKPRGSYSPWSKDIAVEGPSTASQRSTALHEAQHAVQQIEGFARGADNIFLKPNTPAWDIYQERLKAIKTPMTVEEFEKAGIGSPEYTYLEYLKQTKDSVKNNAPMLDRAAQDYAVQEAYRRSAGETEARNVQARRNMEPTELQSKEPWTTQSVPNKEQIVQFHNTEPQMSAKEYKGEHEAPMKDSGAPLHNVTGVYPKDFYGNKGFQHYADFGDKMDRDTYNKIQSYLAMPDRPLTVYRAVPRDPSIKTINKGDWVTINRDYAKNHGEGALNGDYKILKKDVYARDLFTAGDSHHEWGYDPQPSSGLKREDKVALRKDIRGYDVGGTIPFGPEAAQRAVQIAKQQAGRR